MTAVCPNQTLVSHSKITLQHLIGIGFVLFIIYVLFSCNDTYPDIHTHIPAVIPTHSHKVNLL
jgi:hypothetical protein